MAEPLKRFFGEEIVRAIAADLLRVHPAFRANRFVADCMTGLDELELMDRGWRIAEALQRHLPVPFAAATDVIVASLGPELEATDGFGMAPFRHLPHVLFVQKFGLEHFEPAMRAQYELTKRFSAEFSIRAFLVRYPEATYARLREWARDENVHVRRLVSEGTRPRLPWAPRLRAFQQDPRPVIELLELLKDDPERYVQRSVANSLNDIGKDHPDIAVAVCRRWLVRAPASREWIVRHALRTMVKKGDPGALALLGVGAKPRVSVGSVTLSPRPVRLGGTLEFRFEIVSAGKSSQELLVDYAVHFMKANGATRPKVFKLRRLVLAPAERVLLSGAVSFKDMTTRRHFPGAHRIEARINGIAYPLGEFEVVLESRPGRSKRAR